MNPSFWKESITALLVTLEGALLGETTVQPEGNAVVHESRKHARHATADTLSDMEMPGEPVKRRRNSGDSEELARRAYKNRRLSKALSSQFARSLSMMGGGGYFANTGRGHDSPSMDHSPTNEAESNGYISPLSSVSSSSSSLSSLTPWSFGSAAQTLQTTPHSGFIDESGRQFQRALANPTASRTSKAREKSNMVADGFLQLPSSMDMDSSDSGGALPSTMDSSICSELRGTSIAFNGDVFSVLFHAAPSDLRFARREEIDRAVQQWAAKQAAAHGTELSSQFLAGLRERLAQLERQLPPIISRISCDHRDRVALHGESLCEFYRSVCEIAQVGEWLYQYQFPYLPAFFPTLVPVLQSLQELIRLAHVSSDMQALVEWTPRFNSSLKEMCSEYEELVQGKRDMFGDMLSQGGLSWKAIGLPVDNGLILHTQQWFESTTETCLSRIARIYERRANSAAAFGKDDISIDDLALCSSQLIHSVFGCSVLCGKRLTSLAPHILYIVSEYAHWVVGKSSSRTSELSTLRGKSLDSCAMRAMHQSENLVKMLSYVRATLGGDRSVFDLEAKVYESDTVVSGLESLVLSLVDLSWSLAEVLAAYRADGRFANPSGTMLLFTDFVVKFAKRSVDFGGRFSAANQRLHRMQSYLKRLESALC